MLDRLVDRAQALGIPSSDGRARLVDKKYPSEVPGDVAREVGLQRRPNGVGLRAIDLYFRHQRDAASRRGWQTLFCDKRSDLVLWQLLSSKLVRRIQQNFNVRAVLSMPFGELRVDTLCCTSLRGDIDDDHRLWNIQANFRTINCRGLERVDVGRRRAE